MSEATQYLTDIVTLAQGLLDDATGGGNRQHAFQLHVDELALSGVAETLSDLSTDIDDELNSDD